LKRDNLNHILLLGSQARALSVCDAAAVLAEGTRLEGRMTDESERRSPPIENESHWLRSILVLVLTALVAGAPLLLGQVLAGHDIVVYLINAQQTAANQREGELFPAWGGGFNAGFGAPTLLVFPPVTSYLHAIPLHLGVPVIVGVCFWSLVGLLLSGLAMYVWLRSTGWQAGALPASLVYMVAPYRIVDIYHRSALAEHWAFIWPPLILWAATARRLRPEVRLPLVAFASAALVLSNLPLAMLFGVGLAVWFICSKSVRGYRLIVVGGAMLGFAIAAFTLVPQALSSSLLSVDRYYGPEADSFRPSANTLFKGGLQSWDFNAQVSLLVVATFSVVLISYFLLSSESRSRTGARATLIVALICIIATTKPIGFLWDVLPLFSKIQFPWRVACLLTFAVAFMAAMLARRRAWMVFLLVAAISLSFRPWGRTLPLSAFRTPEPPSTPAGSVFPNPRIAWEAGSGGWYWRHQNLAEIWFLAKNVPPFLLPELAGHPAPPLDFIRHQPAALREHPDLPVRVVFWGSLTREVVVDPPVTSTLVWRAISFPGMRVTVDGQPVETLTDPKTGLVALSVPAGKHRVGWSWEPFSSLRTARWVSLAGLSCAVLLLVVSVLRRGGKGAPAPASRS
jgi:hypothetical protein